MSTPEIMPLLEQSAREVLMWVGFGTLVGLAGKAVMPGRDPGGAVGTMMTGIAGSVIGCGTLAFFWDASEITPVSPAGFVLGTLGAFILLFFYRLLAGSVLTEAEDNEQFVHHARRSRRRRKMVHEV